MGIETVAVDRAVIDWKRQIPSVIEWRIQRQRHKQRRHIRGHKQKDTYKDTNKEDKDNGNKDTDKDRNGQKDWIALLTLGCLSGTLYACIEPLLFKSIDICSSVSNNHYNRCS